MTEPTFTTSTTAPEEPSSLVATSVVPVIEVFSSEAADDVTHTMEHPTAVGAPLVFLVKAAPEDGDLLEVHLPVRPNGSTGWVRRSDVELTRNPYRVEVQLAEHVLRVYEGSDVIIDEPVGLGKADVPTPGGTFYVKELLQPPTPDGVYGPYAFGLSGFSPVLESLNGRGEGVIGIHGTNDPSSIGKDSSHGCIRLSNKAITELAGFLPLGTPVQILP